MRILITGTSGLIGRALAGHLKTAHEVIGMGRRDPKIDGVEHVPGNFAVFEDLRKLDGKPMDAVVHLAAVTGGCSERDGMLVNVDGTRRLMRYLIDAGCKKYVMASSIAVIGIQSMRSRPLGLPVPDEHPCLDSEAYGFSKSMMEKVTEYYSRQNEGVDITNLRLSSVMPDDSIRAPGGVTPLGPWAMGSITVMLLQDAVRAFTLAAEAPSRPGLRIYNAAASEAWLSVPTADVLHEWWGDDVDLSWHRQPGNERRGVFDVTRIADGIGFSADATLAKLRSFRG
jgi:nucleoside-diphosphate-sugar epimerase